MMKERSLCVSWGLHRSPPRPNEAEGMGLLGGVESDASSAIRLPRGWAVTLDALPVGTKIYAGSPPTGGEHMALHWIERYAAGIDDEPQIDMIRDALTHPQDASGDAVTGRVNGYMFSARAIEIITDGEVPEWITKPWARVTIIAMPAKEAK